MNEQQEAGIFEESIPEPLYYITNRRTYMDLFLFEIQIFPNVLCKICSKANSEAYRVKDYITPWSAAAFSRPLVQFVGRFIYIGLLSDQPHYPLEILEWCAIWGVLCVAVKPDGTMQHTLVMGEGPETLFSMVSTHTTLTHTAKW